MVLVLIKESPFPIRFLKAILKFSPPVLTFCSNRLSGIFIQPFMLLCEEFTVDPQRLNLPKQHIRLCVETIFIQNGKGERKTQNVFSFFSSLCCLVIGSFAFVCLPLMWMMIQAPSSWASSFSLWNITMLYNGLLLRLWCTPPSNSLFKTLHFWCRVYDFYLLPFLTLLDFSCTSQNIHTCLITPPSNSPIDTPHSGNTCHTRSVMSWTSYLHCLFGKGRRSLETFSHSINIICYSGHTEVLHDSTFGLGFISAQGTRQSLCSPNK